MIYSSASAYPGFQLDLNFIYILSGDPDVYLNGVSNVTSVNSPYLGTHHPVRFYIRNYKWWRRRLSTLILYRKRYVNFIGHK